MLHYPTGISLATISVSVSRALCHVGGKSVLEIRSNDCHSRTSFPYVNVGLILVIPSNSEEDEVVVEVPTGALHGEDISISHELAIRICDDNIPRTGSCICRGS